MERMVPGGWFEVVPLVMDGVAGIFGNNCEVVLRDLRFPERAIVKIINGHVTGRKVGGPIIGGPLDDKGLNLILQKANTQSIVGNYITRARNGRRLKSTTIFFRNAKGVPVIALCINLDLTEFIMSSNLLNEICMNEGKIAG